jgi:acyl-CoA synthetase (AMP-forming)/AMP-acid ligase II
MINFIFAPMNLSDQTKEKIYAAHFVRGVKPDDYKVKFKNIFELVEYRSHLQPDDNYIVFYPDKSEKISLNYKEFTDKVFRTANLLKAHGIGVGDRVATVSHNHINTVIQYFAAWSLGATVVPINVNEEPERIKYILESSHTKLAFVKSEYLEKIIAFQKELPELKKLFVHGITEEGFNPPTPEILIYEDEIQKSSADFTPDESVNQETESLIVYTSGTTGLPKGVVLTQYNLMVDADGIAKWHKIEKGQTLMCVLPIHHVNGTVVTIMTSMYAGGRMVLNQKFHTDKFFTRLADENVQIVSVVPTLLQFLCHDFKDNPPSPLERGQGPARRSFGAGRGEAFRHIICGAGPLTCELALKFEEMFNLKIVHGYGLSETTCYSCFLPVDIPMEEHKKWLKDYGFPSIGVEIEPNEMEIHNDKGEPVAEGGRGEIVIRGHNVMKYYDKNPEANDKTFEFGWFRSGDEGFYKLDGQGRKYFFITGRIKELIIRGGVNIAPLEIDEVLMRIPEIQAGIAVGFDNDWYGEEVGALVLLKEGFDANEYTKAYIVEKCQEHLPFYKTPKVVIFSDAIPVTSTGKYQRNKVKHLFAEFKTVQFKI